jgi:hypothetical protein
MEDKGQGGARDIIGQPWVSVRADESGRLYMHDPLASPPEEEADDLHFKLAQVLKGHYLTDLGCSKEGAGSNAASCWCGWTGERVPAVGLAVNTWVNHTLEEMRPHLAALLSAPTHES